jgi:predicted alpha/beta hydrolase family esterase
VLDEIVDRGDEPFQHVGQLLAFVGRVRAEQMGHQHTATGSDFGVSPFACPGDRDHDHPAIVVARVARGEALVHEPLDGTRGGGWIDSQCIGKFAHPPRRSDGQQVESVGLTLIECVGPGTEEVVAELAHRRAATDLDPRQPDAHGKPELVRLAEIDGLGSGRHAASRVPVMAGHGDDGSAGQATTPLEALGVIATQDVMLTPALRHVEMYTMRGLLTLLWHEPPGESDEPHAASIVLCGGAMGGLLGPAKGLYHRLGVEWAARGVPVLRVSYRRPNDLDACCVDVAAAVQLAVGAAGAERVVVMGHSFGGAVAVRVGVGLRPMVAGVVTFATQSAGCEVAGELADTPLLLFHGDRDEILPFEASEMVRAIAGHGELVRLPGDGHLMAKSGDVLWERLEGWLPAVLQVSLPTSTTFA